MIGIINYGAGNIRSVVNALEKIGEDYVVADRPRGLNCVKKVILPGVGAAGFAMKQLRLRGFDEYLRNLKLPFLGICLGLHVLADFSEEGNVECLGIIPGMVRRFKGVKIPVFAGRTEGKRIIKSKGKINNGAKMTKEIDNLQTLKVPQIGWNKVKFLKQSKLTEGLEQECFFYFVNSFYFKSPDEYQVAETSYGLNFSSIIEKGNFKAVQFHPEKSGDDGLILLNNFCKKC